MNKPWRALTLLIMVVLTACASMKPLPSLPPIVVLTRTARTTTPSQTSTSFKAQMADSDTPEGVIVDDTLIPDLPTLSDDEISQTRTALVALNAAQTQYALLAGPSLTPTPCPKPPCKAPTPTWSPPHTKTPTLTPTATMTPSDLHIDSPGPLSKVISPIHLEATGFTGAAGMIRVEIIGEDGHLMMRQILKYGSMQGSFFILKLNIPFDIPVVAETARLVISVDDAKNRMIALASSDLILLSIGDAQINPPVDILAPIVIHQPGADTVVVNGFMEVKGEVRAMTDQPLLLEVVTDDGAVVGSRQAAAVPTDGAYHPFEAIVPYTVSQARSARLIVRQENLRIPGNVALSSITLTLKP